MSRLSRSAPLFLAPILASCDAADSNGSGHTVVDSAGIRIVESASPVWGDASFRIEAEPSVRIGREEEGPYQFAFVVGAALLDGGRIAVADAGAQEVRVFDPSGEHLITLGRSGEGPGELSGLSRVFEYSADSVAAFDGRLYRTSIFSTTSGGHRTMQNPVEGNYGVFGRVAGGPFLLYDFGGSYRPDLPAGSQWVHTDIVIMDPDDASGRVIASLPNQWRRVAADGNAPMPQPLLYAVPAATDDGFYWGMSDRYEFRLYDVGGHLRRIVRRPVEPRPVTPPMIEEFIEQRLEAVRRFEGESAVPGYRARLEQEEYGSHLPSFGTAFVDRQGRLWVGSSEWPQSSPPEAWTVLSADGVWLGDVRAPEGVRILDADENAVLGIWQDAFDVPHVQLHRLTDGSAGG